MAKRCEICNRELPHHQRDCPHYQAHAQPAGDFDIAAESPDDGTLRARPGAAEPGPDDLIAVVEEEAPLEAAEALEPPAELAEMAEEVVEVVPEAAAEHSQSLSDA